MKKTGFIGEGDLYLANLSVQVGSKQGRFSGLHGGNLP